MGVHPDLQKERDTCSFDVTEFSNIINGGRIQSRRRQELAELVSRDPVLREGDFHRIFLGASDRYERAVHKFARWLEISKEQQLSEEDQQTVLRLIRFDIGLGIHFIMFMPALEKLATDEQKQKWMPLVKRFRVIGTYAQTELGHGTDLRHLEMRVDYDRSTQEFVINTPHVSSMKWWPGSLGLSVNHVLLLAQMYIDGKNYGLQAFLVQIRDMDTHIPLPGVEVGEIGPKMSLSTTDNGFLILRNIRIPRENMLMRYSEVTPDGQFRKKGADQSTYGTMIFIRANICGISMTMLSMATTIATRYSAVRRQTEMVPGKPEQQILDYQTQQMKLFPNMAASFVIMFTHRYIIDMYERITGQMDAGDMSQLPQLHIQSAGFKALTSEIASQGTEIVRQSCGGHGYLLSSGLPGLVWEISAAVTYEGENTVLYLQVARYLMKQLAKSQSGAKADSSLSFLNSPLESSPLSDLSSLCMGHVDVMMGAFNRRTHYFLAQVGQTMQSDMVGGLQMHEAWNRSLVNLVRVAKMYMDGCMIAVSHDAMMGVDCSPQLKTVLFNLFYFHMVHRIVLQSGDFLQCGALTVDQLMAIKREEIRVLALLRPDAVGLMDSFGYTDDMLITTLGRYDGQAYEALYENAKQSPLNAKKVHPAIEKYLLPIVRKAKL